VPEIIVALTEIPLAPYHTPGTQGLGKEVARLVADHDAILLANHGLVSCGDDLHSAYLKMETTEQFAKIVLAAEQAGGVKELPIEEVRNLLQLRESYLAEIKRRYSKP
jgi:L-fuculose-phosphate aldolase